jgi:transcriptional regulator with XRE-family HTH domain
VERLAAALGRTIRQRRVAAGLSQEQLAERAGLHWTYVSQVERGRRNVSVDALRRIGLALGTPGSRLLAEAEAEDANNPNIDGD